MPWSPSVWHGNNIVPDGLMTRCSSGHELRASPSGDVGPGSHLRRDSCLRLAGDLLQVRRPSGIWVTLSVALAYLVTETVIEMLINHL